MLSLFTSSIVPEHRRCVQVLIPLDVAHRVGFLVSIFARETPARLEAESIGKGSKWQALSGVRVVGSEEQRSVINLSKVTSMSEFKEYTHIVFAPPEGA